MVDTVWDQAETLGFAHCPAQMWGSQGRRESKLDGPLAAVSAGQRPTSPGGGTPTGPMTLSTHSGGSWLPGISEGHSLITREGGVVTISTGIMIVLNYCLQ